MDGQILVILFLLLSVVSSLFKKLQERRNPEPDESKLQRKHPSRNVGPQDPFDEMDLSEWEVLLGAPKPETKPKPEPKPQVSEFREVKGKRTVSEANTGPEFREVQGKRDVNESYTGPEFRQVQGTRPINEADAYNENDPTDRPKRLKRSVPLKKKRKRRLKLRFTHQNMRQAIVYNEIIGQPRAENMPF